MIKRYIVKGHSMEPNFYYGDKLLVHSFLFSLKKGDAIIFSIRSKDYLKRIKKVIEKNRFVAVGDNCGHSKEFTVTRQQIKGKLLMKY